jgi:hypothetical protein
MTNEERILVASLAEALVQAKLELLDYSKIDLSKEKATTFTWRPDIDASTQRFARLIPQLEKSKIPGEVPEAEFYELLQEALKGK